MRGEGYCLWSMDTHPLIVMCEEGRCPNYENTEERSGPPFESHQCHLCVNGSQCFISVPPAVLEKLQRVDEMIDLLNDIGTWTWNLPKHLVPIDLQHRRTQLMSKIRMAVK